MNRCGTWVPYTNAKSFLALGFKFEVVFETENSNRVGTQIAKRNPVWVLKKNNQSLTLHVSHLLGSQHSHNSHLPFPFLSLSSPCVADPSRRMGERGPALTTEERPSLLFILFSYGVGG